MRYLDIGAVVFCALSLTACADIDSISRRSNLPSSTTVEGRAIHLDAKQRVVLAKAGTRDGRVDMACAEPSPDALSAFASSLSAGVSVTGQGAGSGAQALSEAAGSIGLRTQSITLMRDALYRVCEAYYNGALTRPQVMALMARSQDLTAAVVSVEQLTGAIVAKQVALGGAADAAASAATLSNAKSLAAARELKAKFEKEAADLTIERDHAVAARDGKKSEISALDAPIAAETDATKQQQLIDQQNGLKEELPPLETAVTDAETRLKLKQKQVEDIDTAIKTMEAQQDSAATSAIAGASSNAALSGGSTVTRLDKETAEAISNAVVAITTSVVNKNYGSTECMAILTSDLDLGEGGPATKLACLDAIVAGANAQAALTQAQAREAEGRALALGMAPLPPPPPKKIN